MEKRTLYRLEHYYCGVWVNLHHIMNLIEKDSADYFSDKKDADRSLKELQTNNPSENFRIISFIPSLVEGK